MMEKEFDKDIDALLRGLRHEGAALETASAVPHLDADEISALAENSLSENYRRAAAHHLADCGHCRRILANVIALNAEAEPISASSASIAAAAHEVAVPWYRRLFAFPQLAYTMGGLVLIFSGVLAYSVLFTSSKVAEVSQIEKPGADSKAGRDVDSAVAKSAPASNAASASQPAVSHNAPSNSNTSISTVANSDRRISEETRAEKDVNPSSSETELKKEKADKPLSLDAAPPAAGAVSPAPAPAITQNDSADSIAETQTRQLKTFPDPSRPYAKGPQRAQQNQRAMEPAPRMAAPRSERTRSVGGRNFEMRQGVWYDTAYRGQSTINVRRNAAVFSTLDAGLRSVANSLSGTVVVVWRDRAYRID